MNINENKEFTVLITCLLDYDVMLKAIQSFGKNLPLKMINEAIIVRIADRRSNY